MTHNLSFLFSSLIALAILGACSTSKKTLDTNTSAPNQTNIGETNSNLICFNHSLLVLDSATYDAVVNSEFIHRFAFSYERKLIGYQGFYLIGKTNYLELFHPKSFEGSEEEEGTIWICLASLKANYLSQLNSEKLDFIEFHSDDAFNCLSLVIEDTILTTWEMKQKHYESWTKKEYHDSISFLPVDYNSPQESDSSSNYLMQDIKGIGLSLNPDDSLKVTRYLKEIGYDSVSEFNGRTRFSSNDQFIELQISQKNKSLSINRYYIQLNKSVEQSTEIIGKSRIECDGKLAIWIFEE